MKSFIILCLFGLTAVAYARPNEQYTSKYDNINLDDILGNERLFKNYMACILDQGKCTSEGKELKSHITEALQENCAKCTKAQQDGTRTVIKHLINNKPEDWKKLKEKYDTEGKYASRYEKELTIIKS